MSKFTFILFFSIIISIKSATEIEARIRKLGDQWLIETGPFSDVYQYIATAFYTNSLEETGWDFLSITTNNFFDDKIQAEAAGRLEGSLTKDRIFNHYTNMLSTAGALKTDTYKSVFIFSRGWTVSRPSLCRISAIPVCPPGPAR